MEEFSKAYEPQQVEDTIYAKWLESGYFTPENLPDFVNRKETFSIMMPPPNVTGVLHLGHALENSLMDAMARYQRLQGKKVLLVPGTDHAALPTQAKVEKMLMQEGIKNPRQELGREKLVEKIREFAENSKSTILSQVKKMGTSADWSRLAYTFDEPRNVAVNELFRRMYEDGLIYQGYRVVNWSVKGQSTNSDDEIVHVERPAKLYTFKYSHDFPITIASTRPETKLGDTAVAVHPADERYQQYIGQIFTVDVGAAEPLSIKIIADDGVDPAFGTGALGVTPAHSPIDFAMYEKQKAKGEPIGIIPVIGIDGRMTDAAGAGYKGLKTEEAREKFVLWLKENNLLLDEQDIVQNVGTSDRFNDVIESLPMTQWWLDVNKVIPGRNKTLRELMREAVTTGLDGNAAQKVTITPEREQKKYLDRVDSLRDWCLSRQTWWGHRIPVWYKGDEKVVGTAPTGEGWEQDPDTLDTWFSSGSWTFSTLGWPTASEDVANYHPTSWITMGYEILYLWLMRMILMSTYALKEIPFKQAYIHGILRDEHGQKFSKSSGNGVDPLEIIKQYGCDALRLSVLSGNTPGNDSRFSLEKVESSRNLVNKIWNISRFIDMTTKGLRHVDATVPTTLSDRWILSRFAATTAKVTQLFEQQDFSLAAEVLREFTWSDFADWYVEIAKVEGGKDDILNFLLERILILWHPFMPFVTEEIYSRFDRGLLMVAKWPGENEFANDNAVSIENEFAVLRDVVTAVRNIRAEKQIPKKDKTSVRIYSNNKNHIESLKNNEKVIWSLGSCDLLDVTNEDPGVVFGVSSAVVKDVTVHVALGDLDAEEESTRLRSEIDAQIKYIEIQNLKLSNQDFLSRAPEKVVALERSKLLDAENKLERLKNELEAFV